MRKFLLFALVATMFAACATDAIDEQSVKVEEQTPDTLVGTFEGDDSRIQLENGKTVWTEGDLVSVFYRSNANQKWQYQGKTGERSGTIKRVANAEATQELSDIVVVYPYNENYYINPRTYNVQAFLPAEQTYLANSYGLDGNIMISASEYKNFALKNVCGWLKIQLTGTSSQKVSSITLKGNNGEQVAGEIYINSADASCELASKSGVLGDDLEVGGTIFEDGTVLTYVTLNCGEGVVLSSTAKSFYIALPPQSFEKGLTIEVACTDGSTMTKTTENAITIERNHIQPMAAFEFVRPQYNNEIHYTATTKIEPYATNVFEANIIYNEWDESTNRGVIIFDKDVTSIGYQAFYNCNSLISVSIPNSVKTLGSDSFKGCVTLENVIIPQNVLTIGTAIFEDCTKLTSVVIHSDLTLISNSMFQGCTNLESITIPESVSSIGSYAFRDCINLRNINIPNGITNIYDYAFWGCSKLLELIIPDAITNIGPGTFYNCSSLTSVTLGSSVASIKESAFGGCNRLLTIYCKPIIPPALWYSPYYGACFPSNSELKIFVPRNSYDAYMAYTKNSDYYSKCMVENWSYYESRIVEYDF